MIETDKMNFPHAWLRSEFLKCVSGRSMSPEGPRDVRNVFWQGIHIVEKIVPLPTMSKNRSMLIYRSPMISVASSSPVHRQTY
jgi:hypothetical protein